MSIVVVGLSHHTAPVTVRERFAVADAAVPELLKKMREGGVVLEAVILSTCNRVELYAVVPSSDPGAASVIRNFFVQHHEAPSSRELYLLQEPQSLEHLFKVACGLDSMVLGETEIFGQLKKAYEIALQHKHTGPRLNKAFQKAFQVAKQVRTETKIQRGSISVGSVAVELAEKIFNSLNDRQVMVIGAGETSEKTARALLSRGAQSILVSNRSHERAVALAQELGGRAVHFEEWGAEFDKIDIIISSTSAPHYILDRTKLEPLMKQRKQRSLLLIDIAVPRDIEPEVNFLEHVYLYNIDDLQTIADQYLQLRREEVAQCEKIIQEKVRGLTFTRPDLPTESPLALKPQ